MATLDTKFPTLLDVAKATDPDGSIARIAEILNETNEILDDMVFVEGNLPTGHRSSIRTGIPEPTWRRLYQGVQPTKGTIVQVTDTTGSLEAYAEIDKKLADLNGNTEAFRLTEDAAHIEGISQEKADTLFYGNETTEPEAFTGLSPRYNSLSADNADNIIDAQGSGSDNESIWLVVWGPNTVHGIYPKGIPAGLQMEDKGQVTIENVDGNGGRMEAYRTHYSLDCGLTVRDWRYVVRIANIDTSLLAANASGEMQALITFMIQAEERIPNLSRGKPAFYCSRNIREKLRLGILEKVANNLTFENVAGKRIVSFDGIPVRRSDALRQNETAVS